MKNNIKPYGTLFLPRWEEIPEMGLYMDQLLNYLNNLFEPLDNKNQAIITNSMVNNYVKNSIVKKPVKKLYKRYHIAFLILVILLKQCFSLSEISEFIKIYSNIEDSNRIARDYNRAIKVFEDIYKEVFTTGESRKIYFENPTYEQQLMLLVFKTVIFKMAVPTLIKSNTSEN